MRYWARVKNDVCVQLVLKTSNMKIWANIWFKKAGESDTILCLRNRNAHNFCCERELFSLYFP